MGYKFGGVKFMVGKVTVEIGHMDTDKLTAGITITIPVEGGKVMLDFHAINGWNGGKEINLKTKYNQYPPPEDRDNNNADDNDEDERDDDHA